MPLKDSVWHICLLKLIKIVSSRKNSAYSHKRFIFRCSIFLSLQNKLNIHKAEPRPSYNALLITNLKALKALRVLILSGGGYSSFSFRIYF